jgi:hypothetical protein
MNRPPGFSASAAANTARERASERQITSVSSPYTRLSGLGLSGAILLDPSLSSFDPTQTWAFF